MVRSPMLLLLLLTFFQREWNEELQRRLLDELALGLGVRRYSDWSHLLPQASADSDWSRLIKAHGSSPHRTLKDLYPEFKFPSLDFEVLERVCCPSISSSPSQGKWANLARAQSLLDSLGQQRGMIRYADWTGPLAPSYSSYPRGIFTNFESIHGLLSSCYQVVDWPQWDFKTDKVGAPFVSHSLRDPLCIERHFCSRPTLERLERSGLCPHLPRPPRIGVWHPPEFDQLCRP